MNQNFLEKQHAYRPDPDGSPRDPSCVICGLEKDHPIHAMASKPIPVNLKAPVQPKSKLRVDPSQLPAAIGLVPEDREPRENWMREWRSPQGVAVGMNEDGTVDEILGDFSVHIEQMDSSYYWARFGDLHVHFSAIRGACRLTLGWVDTKD